MSEVRSVSPIRQRHLWEQIADELRAAILSGEMAPGTRLITAELAERWGVSRGPVREALMALENEGIVVSTRRHGTVVGTTSIVDLEEVLSVREAVETFAAVEVCNLGDEISQADLRKLGDLLKKIEAEKEQGKYEAARNHDFDFHQALVDLAGNSRFSGIYRQMLSQNRHHVRAIDPSRWPLVDGPTCVPCTTRSSTRSWRATRRRCGRRSPSTIGTRGGAPRNRSWRRSHRSRLRRERADSRTSVDC